MEAESEYKVDKAAIKNILGKRASEVVSFVNSILTPSEIRDLSRSAHSVGNLFRDLEGL